VGDDLFVTSVERIRKGIELGVCNSVLIKLNQIGTLTETIDAIQLANRAGYAAVVSTGAAKRRIPRSPICRGAERRADQNWRSLRTDRVAKYNQLLRIEEELFDARRISGMKAFFNLH
jgi:enolase